MNRGMLADAEHETLASLVWRELLLDAPRL